MSVFVSLNKIFEFSDLADDQKTIKIFQNQIKHFSLKRTLNQKYSKEDVENHINVIKKEAEEINFQNASSSITDLINNLMKELMDNKNKFYLKPSFFKILC